MKLLEFEKPLHDIYEKIEELKSLTNSSDINLTDEISKMEKRAEESTKKIFSNLTPIQILQIARHPDRPTTLSICNTIFDKFIELHGDRQFRDDPSLVGGIGRIQGKSVMVIGHQKGENTKDNIYRNFGMPHPEGYRKALRLMKLAQKFNLPIVTFVDTPGAYPGLEAEKRGQAEAIAKNLKEMAQLTVPIISYIIGEGGSGGALGIAVANSLFLLQYSVYSVISPEGCASILFRDSTKANIAAKQLCITAEEVVKFGIADGIIPEPLGGGHRDWQAFSNTIKKHLVSELKKVEKITAKDIRKQRLKKFRNFGQFDSSS